MATFKYTTTAKKLLADLYTPVSVYMRLRDLYPQSALMESSDYHGGENARSFIGIAPIARVAVEHGVAVAQYPDGRRTSRPLEDDYTADMAVNEFLHSFEVEGEYSNLCGLYGYMTFNAVHYLENIQIKDETQSRNDAPDILYILYKYIIVFDHFNNTMILVEMQKEGEQSGLNRIEQEMNRTNVNPYSFHPVGETTSTISDEEHKANVRKGIAHCLRGDVFQIVLSRRFVQKYEGDDFKLYRALRSINPSPYLFYFDFGGFRIFGSSPETHCRIENRRAYIDPIAGTTKRTGNREEDAKGAEFLRNDPKENAEHVMLVDLARNDLSRNCHDVKVDFYKDLQYYSHVIHLVSRV
ncbi:MAG: chorismate-binding protein, partial [Bacteroidales bacterium]|nr:chorismate-binding protein [Bacteroidales bacterium]